MAERAGPQGGGTSGRGSSRVYRAEAVVLKRISIGETDRVVTLFTRNRGKISVIAKGARGPKSRLSGVTEPFTYIHALLAQGQNLDVLTQAEVQSAFAGIRKDLARIGYASYYVELVDAGAAERQPLPELWDLLVAALATVEEATTPDLLTRAFEFQALSILGYEPQVDQCVACGGPVDAAGAVFHPLRGGALCPRCGRAGAGGVALSPGTLQALRELVRQPLIMAAHAELPEAAHRELSRCMLPYIRHHIEAPLRTLQFLEDVTAPAPAAVDPTP